MKYTKEFDMGVRQGYARKAISRRPVTHPTVNPGALCPGRFVQRNMTALADSDDRSLNAPETA
jgi:hypothetical protein